MALEERPRISAAAEVDQRRWTAPRASCVGKRPLDDGSAVEAYTNVHVSCSTTVHYNSRILYYYCVENRTHRLHPATHTRRLTRPRRVRIKWISLDRFGPHITRPTDQCEVYICRSTRDAEQYNRSYRSVIHSYIDVLGENDANMQQFWVSTYG